MRKTIKYIPIYNGEFNKVAEETTKSHWVVGIKDDNKDISLIRLGIKIVECILLWASASYIITQVVLSLWR